MKIVVDSNILVSAILNKESNIAQFLILGKERFSFYAPELLKLEIERHKVKLMEIAKLSILDFESLQALLYECLIFVPEEQIPFKYWHDALPIVRDVDPDDIAFVALSEFLGARLWTGDKKLLKGMYDRGYESGITTEKLLHIWLAS